MTAIVFSLMIGISGVLQGGINKKMMDVWGLFPTILFNSIIVLILCIMLYGLSSLDFSWLGEGMHNKHAFKGFKLWHMIPGLCGLVIIAGLPLAIAQIGATRVFITVVVAQMFASMIWDKLHDSIEFSWIKLTGVALGIFSVLLINWKS